MSGLPWWSKVRAHIDAGKVSYATLAERTGLSERTLRRWVGRSPDADPRYGPGGELLFVQRISSALGWPLWYLANDEFGYPPADAYLRLGAAVAALPEDRREILLQLLSVEMTELVTFLADHYGEVRDKVRRRWEGAYLAPHEREGEAAG